MQKEDNDLKFIRRINLFEKIMLGIATLNYIAGCVYVIYEYSKTGNLDTNLSTFPLYGLSAVAVSGTMVFGNCMAKKIEEKFDNSIKKNKSKNLEYSI